MLNILSLNKAFQHLFSKLCFSYFLESVLLFCDKNLFKISLHFCTFLPKNQQNWFQKNIRDMEMVGYRKLFDPSLNRIFNPLLIGLPSHFSDVWFWTEVPSFNWKFLLTLQTCFFCFRVKEPIFYGKSLEERCYKL